MEKEIRHMIVSSKARAPLAELYPPDGKLPSLIDDARANPLIRIAAPKGEVLIKPPTLPYAEHHMLVIPDRSDQEATTSVIRVPEKLLAVSFATVGEIASHYQANPDILEVNTGWNYSPLENIKHVATQPKTLHLHVTGYTHDDLNHTVGMDEIRSRPELRTKQQEPLADVIAAIAHNEIFSEMENESFFREHFQRIDDGNRVTYEMPKGLTTISDPKIAYTMQDIHVRAVNVYSEIARRFFASDPIDPTHFAQTEAYGNRFALLPKEERIGRVDAYLSERTYFTDEQKNKMRLLAKNSMPMEDLHEQLQTKKGRELTDDEKYGRNPAMALKGLAYASVMTGVRSTDGSFHWKFGFDPVVFAPRDIVQASRGTFSHFERMSGEVMSEAARFRMQHDEIVLAQKLGKSVS